MTNISLTECVSYKVNFIDYVKVEKELRIKNLKMLEELLNIYMDAKCTKVLAKRKILETTDVPTKMIDFYNKYISKDHSTTDKATIIKKIKEEIKDLKDKVRKYANKWDDTTHNVFDNMPGNDFLLRVFAKDPTKQTFHQPLAAEWIKNIPFIENLKQLHNNGEEAFYIINGKIISGKEKDDQKTGKSIDFIFEYLFRDKTLLFYASHKYTDISGGSQDNQYKDTQEFHTEARNCINPNTCLLSITDGPYYLKREARVKQQRITKLEYLNRQFKGYNNLATTSNTFVQDVTPIIINWLKANFNEVDPDVSEEIDKLNTLAKRFSDELNPAA